MMIMNNDPGKDVMFVEDTSINGIIDDYDKKMLGYIARLYQAINGEKLDFDKIGSAVDALQEYNSKNEYRYLNNLLHPERCKGVKIPSQIPIPSCSFQLHNCVTLRTNSSGNLAIVFNPYFLASNVHKEYADEFITQTESGTLSQTFHTNYYSSLYVNNDNSLNGYSENNNWNLINIGQEIPPVYDQYRLVSASLVVKYIGRLDTVSGVIGGAIVYDETPEIGCDYTYVFTENSSVVAKHDRTFIPQNLGKYGNFDLAMDAFYRQENLCLEGIRQLYFPIDNSYEEYTRLMNDNLVKIKKIETTDYNVTTGQFTVGEEYLKNGFRQVVYVLGAPANQACFKLDIYCNFECLPASPFLNYLPLSMNTEFTSPEIKKKSSVIIQQKPIMKSTEEVSSVSAAPSIWQKMKNKFMDSLPGIGKLIASGLVQAIPQLQLGTGLANAMSIAANTVSSLISNNSSSSAPNSSSAVSSVPPISSVTSSVSVPPGMNPVDFSKIPVSNSTIIIP